MKVGIIGSADVGQALGTGFHSEGHEVMIGSRHTGKEDLVNWEKKHKGAKLGSFKEAAAFGDIVVLAVGGDVVENAIELAGGENLSGKIVIDVTNPISKDAKPEDGVLKFFTTQDESLMERLQKQNPKAKFVKSFNIIGSDLMYKPKLKGGPPTMFICGNDEGAKKKVTDILIAFGFEVEDMGTAKAAGCIESLCVLWCIPGFLKNQWSHAFKLLK